MTNLYQSLNTLNGIRMMQSNNVESYWELSTELLSMARHILQSGLYIVISFYKLFMIKIMLNREDI